MLRVVGLGPGDTALLTPQAQAAISSCQVLVGYNRYLDLIPQEMKEGKTLVATGMTKEIDRCRAALDHAAQGSETVIVSSGDPGIYGMAGLIVEMAEQWTTPVDVEVVPGLPALAAAAALLGAPLTHDFAVISLSDLLTPWDLIERRLDCAGAGDFVTVIYNPRSKKRHWQLARALAILSRHRAPGTPVGLVRQAFRPGQFIHVATLSDFNPSTVDMLSILVVGNSSTRTSMGRMLTPRGYGRKYGTLDMKGSGEAEG